MQLRYSYRLYPDPRQRQAFGCARVVFSDALAARQAAHAAGEPYLSDAAVSAALTASKRAPERAKSVHDAGWSAFTAMLEYKAKLYGREFRRIGRFEPTSQVCSACGVKDGPKPLAVREWTCTECGTVHDRDVNAAKNIAALGRREAQNARGGDVRPANTAADPGEAGSLRSAA